MNERASNLSRWARDRIGGGLRSVGYHSGDEYGVVYLREDIEDRYSTEEVEDLITTVRDLDDDVQEFEGKLGTARESLYVLEDSLIVQFHFLGAGAVFMSVDFDVGRNFVSFIEECRSQMT